MRPSPTAPTSRALGSCDTKTRGLSVLNSLAAAVAEAADAEGLWQPVHQRIQAS